MIPPLCRRSRIIVSLLRRSEGGVAFRETAVQWCKRNCCRRRSMQARSSRRKVLKHASRVVGHFRLRGDHAAPPVLWIDFP